MNVKVLKFQKVLRWIPYINFTTVFLWIFTGIKFNVPVKEFLSKLVVMMAVFIAFVVPRVIVDITTSNEMLYTIVTQVTTILQTSFCSFYAVRQQELILRNQKGG